MSVVLWPERADGDRADLGGKARGLVALARNGHPVPRWFAVSARAFDAVCGRPEVAAARRALAEATDDADVLRVAAELRELIDVAEVDAGAWDAIVRAYALLAPGDGPVAVRSSASVEDARSASFAGQFATTLDVRGRPSLERAIRACWASAFSDRTLAYQRVRGSQSAVRMAVVIQRMVGARTSGVLFTRDPADGADDAMVIAATAGLGQRLVAGEIEGSTYRVSRRTGAALDGSASEGTLTRREIGQLRRLALRIEHQVGSPQDIEWAIADGAVAVLQSRPITGPPTVPAVPNVWDNANIVESFPGVTLPLTYSIAREAYAAVYRQAMELAGVPRRTLDAHDGDLQRMIGLIRGRVYYRLNGWYALLALLPGAAYTTRYMEQMMGVRRSMEPAAPRIRSRSRILEAARLAILAARMAALALSVRRRVVEFRRLVDTVCSEEEDADVERLGPRELVDRYEWLRSRLFASWQAPILNDFITMLACGVARRLVARREPERAGAIVNELLRDHVATPSAEPAHALAELARIVARDPALARTFREAGSARAAVEEARRDAAFAEALDRYLRRHGHRRAQELKLEVLGLRDDPSPLVAAIRAYLERPDLDVAHRGPRETVARGAAEGTARAAPGPVTAALSGWVVRCAREHIRYREEMRSARGRVFAVARTIFSALGRRLHERGDLDDPRDIFYLTVDEACGLAAGATPSADVRTIVAERRREFDAYAVEPPLPDRFQTIDADGAGDRVAARADIAPSDGRTLRGTPANGGIARGPTRLMRSPHEERLERGEILVAHATDPGWVTVFPFAAGILVERGSVLSHSAILARELGIPAIVGIARLTAVLGAGQRVEMDGGRGTVTVLGS